MCEIRRKHPGHHVLRHQFGDNDIASVSVSDLKVAIYKISFWI
jgi:hypothetical protein